MLGAGARKKTQGLVLNRFTPLTFLSSSEKFILSGFLFRSPNITQMQRREFIKETSMFAFGVGAFGNIQFRDNRFVGDNPTTTDILGPFYRPNAPFRTNLNPPGY